MAAPYAGLTIAQSIFLDLRDQLGSLDVDRLRIYRSEFERIEAKYVDTDPAVRDVV